MEQSFYDWLVEQVERRGPTGDFARAAVEDDDFPRQASSRKVIRRYLTANGVGSAGLAAFDEVFNEYMEDDQLH